jgi:hypothetical protein
VEKSESANKGGDRGPVEIKGKPVFDLESLVAYKNALMEPD